MDDDDELDDIVGAAENLLGGFFSMTPQSDPLREAVQNEDYDLARQLITQGSDPFFAATTVMDPDGVSAFCEASGQGSNNIELLLTMAALPGCEWRKRFMLSKNGIMDAPARGRPSIPSSCSGNFFNFFSRPRYTSFESMEIMMMFGYQLKSSDFEYSLLPLAFEDTESNMRMLKFAIAAGHTKQLKLEICLGMAVGGNHGSFIGGSHPTSLKLARALLKLGADPNGYCFQGDTPYDCLPALYQALENRDEEMAKLLVAYGADFSRGAQFTSWLDIEEVSIRQKAEEHNMAHVLVSPEEVTKANPGSYIKELRRELEVPLKKLIPDYSGALVVAIMRATGRPPSVGLMSRLMLVYCPLGFDLWQIDIRDLEQEVAPPSE